MSQFQVPGRGTILTSRGQHGRSTVLIHSGDAFFKWVKIEPTGTATSAWTGNEQRQLFYIFKCLYRTMKASLSHNKTLVGHLSHNTRSKGLSFKTMELGAYKTIVPISNGQAEVYVQIVKNCLHSMSGERGTLQYKLRRLIVQLRQSMNYTGTFSFI